jgi:hypothetical protein
MGDLTPFQNQVLDAAEAKEAEEKERKREEARNQQATGGRSRNARAGKGGGRAANTSMEQEETVRYVNKDLNPDHEVHQSE